MESFASTNSMPLTADIPRGVWIQKPARPDLAHIYHFNYLPSLGELAAEQGVKPTNFDDLLGTERDLCDCTIEPMCLWHVEFNHFGYE